MSISTRGLILAAAILMVGGLVWLVCSWPPSRSRRLADGSLLRVEKVSSGRRDPAYMPAVSLWEQAKAKVAAMLPQKWAAKITLKKFSSNGNWWMNTTVHTNLDALHIWITQRDPTNGFGVVQAGEAEVLDEHGCVYPSTQSGGVSMPTGMAAGGGGPSGSAMTWFTFEAFPRHDSRMRLRLYKSSWSGRGPNRELLAEFVILNPAPKPADPTKWATEPLPIERKYGDVSFILKGVGFKTNWVEWPTNSSRRYYSANPVEIVPKLEVSEQGKQLPEWEFPDMLFQRQSFFVFGEPAPAWEALDMELTDSSGDFAPKQWGNNMSAFLSPREPAWKLAVKFFGSEREGAASNTVWVMRGVNVPGPAAFSAFTNQQYLDGVLVKPIALAGACEATYRGDELAKITNHGSARHNDIRFGAGYGNSVSYGGTDEIVDTARQHFAMHLDHLQDDQRLTIRAVAAGGREYYAEPWRYGTNTARTNQIPYLQNGPIPYRLNYFPIDLPADVRTVDLYFCVHRARTVEFVFKPPQQ
jgi:hypothetical protein